MIVDALLALIKGLLEFLSNLFPDYSPSLDPFTGWGLGLSHLADLNYFLPISELFAFTIGVVVIFPMLAGVSLFVWLVSFLRGGSARA